MGLLILLIGRNTSAFTSKASYRIFVRDIKGLAENNLVSVSGKKVGTVTRLTFATGVDTVRTRMDSTGSAGVPRTVAKLDSVVGIEVDFEVNREFSYLVRTDSKASIKAQGILGDKFIDINPGAGKPIEEGKFLPVTTEAGLDELTGTASEVMASLEVVLKKIERGEGSVGKLLTSDELANELTTTTRNLAAFTSKLSNGNGLAPRLINDGAMASNISSMTKNLSEVTESLRSGKGSLGKLMVDEGFYNNLNSMSKRADSLVTALNNPNGTLGKLSNDAALYNNLNSTAASLDSLLNDFKQNPSRYVKFSVF